MSILNFKTRSKMTLDEVLEGFYPLRAETTQDQYEGIVRQWEAYLKRAGLTWESAKEADAALFLDLKAKDKGQKPRGIGSDRNTKATVKRYAYVLHAMSKYLVAHGILERDIFLTSLDRLKHVKTGDKRNTQMIPFEFVGRLLESQSEHSARGERNRIILTLLFGLGLRISETLGLCLGDVIEISKEVTVIRLRQTKSGHEQELPIADWIKPRLKKYMDRRLHEGASLQSPLFPSYRGGNTENHISASTGLRLFKRLCKEAGIVGNFTPHSARATFISKLLEDGNSYRAVQEASRHSSIALVERYDKRLISLEQNVSRKISYDTEKK